MNLRHYFQSYQSYFWEWEEDGKVLSVANGNTIAYWPVVEELLRELQPQGIPPVGSLLLVLSALQPNALETLDQIQRLMEPHGWSKYFGSIQQFLEQLTRLPDEYKQGKKRLLFFQTLFENAHNSLSPSKAAQVLSLYAESLELRQKVQHPQPLHEANAYHRDTSCLLVVIRRFPTLEAILQKLAEIPDVSEHLPDLPPSETESEYWLDTLLYEPKTFHIAALVQRIWSGLQIPFHNRLPSEQPLGGVSDLTNKGDFDKLLISEYANDDLVFLSRLANNEALFIRREVPPASNNLERVLLLDVSIKNWGTPRTLAFALLLAIARHPKTDIPCRAFVVGDSYRPIAFGTPEELMDSLLRMEPCLSPAKGIELFFQYEKLAASCELFLVSAAEVLHQPDMLRCLSAYRGRFGYWLETDNEGKIDLFKQQKNGRKYVQTLRLPLTELWANPPKRAPKESKKTEFPSSFPLLFPAPSNVRRLLVADPKTVFVLTNDRRVLRFYDAPQSVQIKDGKVPPYQLNFRDKGWEMLSYLLPEAVGNNDYAVGVDSHGDAWLFKMANQRELIFTNLRTHWTISHVFKQWTTSNLPQFFYANDAFHFLLKNYNQNRHFSFKPLEMENRVRVEEEELDAHWQEIYTQVQEEEMAVRALLPLPDFSLLKNVKSVFINQLNNLVFNTHEFRRNDHGIIKLDKTGFLKPLATATGNHSNTEFVFPEGSTVSIHHTGMFILRSSDPAIPPIFVPAALDANLGIGNEEHFSGNNYYFPTQNANDARIQPTAIFWKEQVARFVTRVLEG